MLYLRGCLKTYIRFTPLFNTKLVGKFYLPLYTKYRWVKQTVCYLMADKGNEMSICDWWDCLCCLNAADM